MPMILMLKGLQGSGKTTYANKLVAGGNWLRVSRDDIREGMLGEYSPQKERLVVNLQNKLIVEGLKLGKNVVIDNTNLSPNSERVFKQLAKKLGAQFQVEDRFLEEDPETCIKRDLRRGDKAVGAGVIWDTYFKRIAPDPAIKLDMENDKRRAFCCDLDGTLAIKVTNRSYSDWKRVGEDRVNPLVSLLLDAVYEAERYYCDVLLVSSRAESARKETEDWLEQNCIAYDKLLMRADEDRRDSAEVKVEIYQTQIEPNYAVVGIIEDRPKDFRALKKQGYEVLHIGNPYLEF